MAFQNSISFQDEIENQQPKINSNILSSPSFFSPSMHHKSEILVDDSLDFLYATSSEYSFETVDESKSILSMIKNQIDTKLKDEHWDGSIIGIQTLQNFVQLMENSNEFNKLSLIDSKGNFHRIDQIIQPDDDFVDNSLQIKYKMVPVIESIKMMKNSVETEYKFCNEINDDNNNDVKCEDNCYDSVVNVIIDDTQFESTKEDNYEECLESLIEISSSSDESKNSSGLLYSEFLSSIPVRPRSIFISTPHNKFVIFINVFIS